MPPEKIDQGYQEEILPEKLALDQEYIENRSLPLDIKILFGAVFTVLKS